MTLTGAFVALVAGLVAGLVGYYVALHVEWRAEVERRRLDRARERAFLEMLEPRTNGNADVLEDATL